MRSEADSLDVELAASGFDSTTRSEFEREIGQQGWHRLHDGEDGDEGSDHDEEDAPAEEEVVDDDAPCASATAAVSDEEDEVQAVDGPTAAEVASDRLLAERRKMARKAAMAQASRNAAKDKRHNSRRSVSSSMSFGW